MVVPSFPQLQAELDNSTGMFGEFDGMNMKKVLSRCGKISSALSILYVMRYCLCSHGEGMQWRATVGHAGVHSRYGWRRCVLSFHMGSFFVLTVTKC